MTSQVKLAKISTGDLSPESKEKVHFNNNELKLKKYSNPHAISYNLSSNMKNLYSFYSKVQNGNLF